MLETSKPVIHLARFVSIVYRTEEVGRRWWVKRPSVLTLQCFIHSPLSSSMAVARPRTTRTSEPTSLSVHEPLSSATSMPSGNSATVCKMATASAKTSPRGVDPRPSEAT